MLSDLRLLRGEPASEPGAPGLRCPAKDPRSGPARPVLPAAGRATKPNAIADIAWDPTDIPRPSKFIATIAGLDLHIVDDLQAAGPAWTEFQRRAWFTPFQDHGWVAAWLATQRGTARTGMCIVFGYENGQLRLILPLTVKRKFAQTRLAWAAGAINDLNSPLIDPQLLSRIGAETANRIWAAVVQAVAADAVVLTRQPARLAQSDNPFLADGAQGGSCESHALKLGPDWATLYAGLRSSKSRRRLREKAGKLRKAGKLCFKAERNVAQREAMIERILAWKSQQLRSLGDVDPFSEGYLRRTSTSEIRSAIFNYARSDPGARKLWVYVLSLDGQPLAGIVALVGRRTFSVLTTAYCPDLHAAASPGTCLMVKCLELAARARLDRFDFLAGDEPYKFDWCNEHLGLFDHVAGITVAGRAYAVLLRSALRIKKALKSRPRALAILKRANAFRFRLADRFLVPVSNLRKPAVRTGTASLGPNGLERHNI